MTTTEVRPGELVRPVWQRSRYWAILGVLLLAGAVLLTLLNQPPSNPLDPSSPDSTGTRALAVLLANRGVTIDRTTSLDAAVNAPAGSTVLVAFPDDLSGAQLGQLMSSGHRIVAVAPGTVALRALRPDLTALAEPAALVDPGCDWAGAAATGPVSFPGGESFSDPKACYDQRVLGLSPEDPGPVVLGSADLLTNHYLAGTGAAALAINALTNDGQVARLTWLLPGGEDRGAAPASIWSLFPSWTVRAFWWLAFVVVLVALWRGRRLGRLVTEQLPVVVRAAEVVEGHGRLYRRSSARDRAAAALRTATFNRLVHRLGLPRGSDVDAVATALAHTNTSSAEGQGGAEADFVRQVTDTLAGPIPADDDRLARLGQDLSELEQPNRPTPIPPEARS